MAVDVALMARAEETGEAVFRVYGWSQPTLSFGRHETVRDRFDSAALAARGYDAVRRPTGGRVLLHDGDVTYSVTAPASDTEPVHEAYARINAMLSAALGRLGVDAAPAAPARPERRPGRDTCFAAPSAGELVVDGRKLVASAQRRDSGALLQHGSILLVDRQGVLTDLAAPGLPAPATAATLSGALGRTVTRTEVHAALRATLENDHGPVESLSDDDVANRAGPLVARFADPQWTWRR